jgi:hypothetical protein
MDTQNTGGIAVDLTAFIPQDVAVLNVLRAGGIEETGWKITFAGPSHPQTLAWSEASARKNLRRQAQIEQAQVNGKKFKAEEREPDDVRRENIAYVVARIVDWSPVRLGPGEPILFSPAAATELLLRPELGFVYTQALEFLGEERSFTKGSAKPSGDTQGDTSSS